MKFLYCNLFSYGQIINKQSFKASNILKMSVQAKKIPPFTYSEAMKLLNGLQPTNSTLAMSNNEPERSLILSTSRRILSVLGINDDDLTKLNIVHMAGTKGKGSTCAFVESILRRKGYKTGFFSSPHMVEVRERIRLDGKPMSRDLFAKYFLEVYDIISKSDEKLPNYFRFLCAMSYYVFLKEKVDVAVVEVGVGGQFDTTNVMSKPAVCGVANLGLDHTDFLGNTLGQIAWNKAGIFKKGTPAVTIPQKDEAMQVLVARAREKQIPLYVCEPLDVDVSSLGIPGQVQLYNASLAINIANIWLERNAKEKPQEYPEPSEDTSLPIQLPRISLTPELALSLKETRWPGRCQKYHFPGVTYYLDGAHTEDSMRESGRWFQEQTSKEASEHKGRVIKVLIFSVTGFRDSYSLLKEIKDFGFDYTIFTPTFSSSFQDNSADLKKMGENRESLLMRCFSSKSSWEKCRNGTNGLDDKLKDVNNNNINESTVLSSIILPTHPITQPSEGPTSFVFPSIQDSLVWATSNKDKRFALTEEQVASLGFKFKFDDCNNKSMLSNGHDDVLVQIVCLGSLYLVGGVLSFIDPNLGY